MKELSVILPIYNEEKSIPELFEVLFDVLKDYSYEILAVNDGSRDNSYEALEKIALQHKQVKVIDFRRNSGQTAAINAGIQYSKGQTIVMLDSDLENDPKDIPALLAKLEEGYDVVSGWRQNRWKGQYLTRKLPSKMANKLISRVSGVHLHDYGCTLKVYRRSVIENVNLYGQMHRFIPVYCSWQGGKIAEMPVNYQPRKYGQSNYGMGRTFKVILDLLLLKFLDKYMQKPIHFFGGAGLIFFVLSFLFGGLSVYLKYFGGKSFIETPLPIFMAMFFIVGVLMILMGVIAEILMRTYYESQSKFPFSVKRHINLEE